VLLVPNRVCLLEKAFELRIYELSRFQPEVVSVIARRERLDLVEFIGFDSLCEYRMPNMAMAAWCELCE
jgi:hypothetical protein